MKKRKIFLSILLALCLVVTLLPIDRITSFATEATEAAIQETTKISEEEKKEEVEAPAENEKDADEKETDIEDKTSEETVVQEETSEVEESEDDSDNEAEVIEDTAQSEKETYSPNEEKSEDISEDAKPKDSTKDTTKKKCDPEKEDTKEVKSLNNIRTLRVTKVWLDDFNRDGIRPKSVQVQLYQNGNKCKEVTLTAKTAWTHIFRDLPIINKKTGKAYVYTVTETPVKGYLIGITADVTGYNIINTHIPETTKVSVEKSWDDNNDQDGIRPDSIEVQLKANGCPVGKPVTLSENNNWNYVWKLLPKNKCGKPITYTVEEKNVPEGYDPVYTSVPNEKKTVCTITNTHKQSDQPEKPGDPDEPKDPDSEEPGDPKPGNPPIEDVIPDAPTTPENPDSSTEVVYNEPNVTTENPDGQTNTDDETSIDDDSEKKVTETKDNKKTDTKETESKKTGDTTPIGFFIILLAVSMLGIMGIIFGKEKRIGKHNK